MNSERMPKREVTVRIGGKSKKCRPWRDGPDKVEYSLRVKGIRNRSAVTRNWKEWRKIVLEAEVPNRM
jgi:ABC-type taurine transport system ATPase subunit